MRNTAMKPLAVLSLLLAAAPAFAQPKAEPDPRIGRGRYIVEIAGCNDCHTAGYAMSGGKVPQAQWLLGDTLGWQGPWGTTYAPNLRRYMQGMTEGQWVKKAKSLETRPPMPWFNVRAMSNADLRAVYRYIRHLGPAGDDAPAYVPPGGKVSTPVVVFPAPPGK